MARNTSRVDEELEIKLTREHLKRVKGYLKPYKKHFIITIILMVIAGIAAQANPLIISYFMDYYIPNENINAMLIGGGIMLALWLIVVLFQRARMHYMNITGQGIIHKMRSDLFANIQNLSFDFFDSRPHGKILIRVVNYINSLADMFSNGLVQVILDVFNLFIVLGFMFFLDWRLTLVALAGMPVLIAVVMILQPAQRRAWQAFSNKISNLNAYTHESIAGMRVTQSFAREEENLDIFKEITDDTKKSWYDAMKIQILLWPIIHMISNLVITAVYVVTIFWFAGGPNAVSIGIITAFIIYVQQFWQPITNIGNFYNAIVTNTAYLERIFETMDEKPLIQDSPEAFEMPAIRGEVEFKNVDFGYKDGNGKLVLENLSFKVNDGESIALVGHTGAGKTTVTSLISRFYDVTAGEVLVDGINVKDVKIKSLRRQMGVMMQDSFVFSGNIIDNIRYGNYEATDEEVIAAAKAVRADEFISALPDGYYTEVTERGSTLSAGQRQLISFARALLANPKILILDEATSSIDTRTEMALQKGLEELLKGRTSFVIAHRLSTIKNATKIMVIGGGTAASGGGIIECGSHDELLKNKGQYYELCRAQYEFLN